MPNSDSTQPVEDVTPEEIEGAKAIIRSIRRTVPADEMLNRVRPVGSDLPFGNTRPNVSDS